MMIRKILSGLFLLSFLCVHTAATAAPVDDLETLLRENPQVQEKVYVHTDNSAYFVGDTLWYKAYVVRSVDLKPTDMSKLLYVELLTPDGYLVERQHVIVSATGHTCGQFILEDSLYSGFYEIRAYTRWQLNFNVKERDYTRDDRWKFLGKQNAADFFRDWDGLYSRVVPIYQKPAELGNYADRYMSHRPKTRILKDKEFLTMSFYPEGGELVEGIPCNLAFEVKENHGEGLELEGTLSNGAKIKSQRFGMGQVTVTPDAKPLKATFNWHGKDYSFTLPKAQATGASISLDAVKGTAKIVSKGVKPAAYAMLCRGKLDRFERISAQGDVAELTLNTQQLQTGVNELIIYDDNAQPLASRLFFVNNHDYGKPMEVKLTTNGTEIVKNTTVEPYAPIDVELSGASFPSVGGVGGGSLSLAIRDAQTDERGYDDGNIMTDMLLSSELKGFIAYPGYYFESDDAQHTADLDLLMKVQGWRKYKRVDAMRYEPETSLTFEGTVHKVPAEVNILEYDDLAGIGTKTPTVADKMREEMGIESVNSSIVEQTENLDGSSSYITDNGTVNETEVEVASADQGNSVLAGGRSVRNVLVEAEINKNGEMAGAVTRTDHSGHFQINLPAYYGWAYLFVKAYTPGDSITKNMQSGKADKHFMDERAFPDFFVKQDKFFPIYSKPYSWYQTNSPQLQFVDEDEDDAAIPESSRLAGTHQLQTVVVKARRRGRRAIDKSKPAIVMDAYELYNELTDRGLMFGVCDFRNFPLAAATYLFGNMGRRYQFTVRAMYNGTSFFRNYTPGETEYDKPMSQAEMFNNLRLERMQYIKAYTDYELRTDSGDVMSSNVADVTLDFVPVANDGKRPTYRDRRYILDGIAWPEQFYSPDYSQAIPDKKEDYRRTLYWNPNVKLNADGTFRTTIYNNCRETRVSVSAAGVDVRGQMYYK